MLRTWSGAIAPLDKESGAVVTLDVVMGLGRARRFGSQGDLEWTDLHHRAFCAFIWLRLGFPVEQLVYPLHHDDHEAYTTDIPAPIKQALNNIAGKPVTKTLERCIDTRLNEHFNVPAPVDSVKRRVKYVDTLAGVMESVLFGPVLCDLNEVVEDETLRAKIAADIERVEPGFWALVKRRGRA